MANKEYERDDARLRTEDPVMPLTVNGEQIDDREVHAEMRLLLRAYVERLGPEEIKEKLSSLWDKAADLVIGRKLLLQEARRREVPIPAVEIEEEIDALKKRCGGDSGLAEHLSSLGMNKESLVASIVQARLVDQLVGDITVDVKEPTEQEISKFFENNPERFVKQESVKISHILVRYDSSIPNDRERAQSKVEILHEQVLEGHDFSEIAKHHSDCPSGKAGGGELDDIERGQWLPELEDTVFNMKTGEMSEPLESSIGFHIVRKIDHGYGHALDFSQARDGIRDLLNTKRKNEKLEAFVGELRENALIEGEFDRKHGDVNPLDMSDE